MVKLNDELLDPENWVDDHGDVLYGYAMSRLRDPLLAEDLVQETLLVALQAKKRFLGQSSIRTWLTGILRHKILEYYRKIRRERRYDNPYPASARSDDYFDRKGQWTTEPTAWWMNPQKAIQQQEFVEVLGRSLDALPPMQHKAFVLRELDGIDGNEICNILGITSSNLWVILHRARETLKTSLKEIWLTDKGSPTSESVLRGG
ncbi:MAG: sigma-70 family RNA polymerase sigma factor [Planctomycetota bacterium]|jgi:RNA polymerase sigma-70 factor (ECF subfamily)